MAKIGLPKGSGKRVESQGKVSEKSGNFEMDIEWQPCLTGYNYHHGPYMSIYA